MKRITLTAFTFALALAALIPFQSTSGQRRRVAYRRAPVVHRPVVHTRLVVRKGYPIRRVLPSTVVVRPARRVVTVGAPLVFLPGMVWTPRVAVLPSSDRLSWQDSEVIEREEGWVDSNFGIDSKGNALFLQISGTVELNFCEIAFANGNVQVVDFNSRMHGSGVYNLLDFSDGRHVKTVRLIAKSDSDETKVAVYLSN